MTNNVRGYLQLHPYHLVGPSPWPVFTSFSLLNLALSLGFSMHQYMPSHWILLSIVTVFYSMFLWFKDIIAESTYLGDHTKAVKRGITQGFYLFVVSEILIFASLFWAFLHSSINPTIEIGMSWPPAGITAISPNELPLLNTIILLASGVTVTKAHYGLITGIRPLTLRALTLTTLLILIFVILQGLEYRYAPFTISDGVFGSTFYSLTGLHGVHMIMLFIMLFNCTYRIYNYDFTNKGHLFAELSILYLHVLDLLWLFIYFLVYWWGN